MKKFLTALFVLFVITDVFAQFPSTGNHFYFYKYEFSEEDGVKTQRSRYQSDYYLFFIHNGEIVYTRFSQPSLDSQLTALINEKKDEVQYFYGYKDNRYFYDNSLSNSGNSVYVPYRNSFGNAFVVSRNFDKLIEFNRSGVGPNGHFVRVLESDLTKPKAKPRFFDE